MTVCSWTNWAFLPSDVLSTDYTTFRFVRSHVDYDDGVMEYEVEFYAGNKEYDYDIDAATGAIRSMDQDCEFYVQ